MSTRGINFYFRLAKKRPKTPKPDLTTRLLKNLHRPPTHFKLATMGWQEIPNGNSSYFYNDETRESSYVIPPSLLEEKIAYAQTAVPNRSQTLSTASRASPTARSPIVNEKKAEQRRISQAAMEAWTVQVRGFWSDMGWTCKYCVFMCQRMRCPFSSSATNSILLPSQPLPPNPQ